MLSGRFHARMIDGLLAIFGSQLETTAVIKHSCVTRGREKRGQREKEKGTSSKAGGNSRASQHSREHV